MAAAAKHDRGIIIITFLLDTNTVGIVSFMLIFPKKVITFSLKLLLCE